MEQVPDVGHHTHALPYSRCLGGIPITPEMVANIYTDNSERHLMETQQLRKLLQREPNPPIEEVIQTGVVPKLVDFLHCGRNHKLQYEAAWVLTNIASGSTKQTQLVVEAGAVPIFIHLLGSEHQEVQEQAIWALGNIAGDSPKCRDYVLEQGALKPLLKILQKSTCTSVVRNIVWTLHNLCRGTNPPPKFDDISPCLLYLKELLFVYDYEVVAYATWALSYALAGPKDKLDEVFRFDNIGYDLVCLLKHMSENVVLAALRGLTAIAAGNDDARTSLVHSKVLPSLFRHLSLSKVSICREACRVIARITAGNSNHIKAVIEAGIFPPLVDVLTRADVETKKEAASAVTNVTRGGLPEQIRHLVECGCVPPLCNLLTSSDPNAVQVALQGMENILLLGESDRRPGSFNPYTVLVENYFGPNKMEFLQFHESSEIAHRAYEMMERFFDGGEEDVRVAPGTLQCQFDFGVAASSIKDFDF